jgi:NAD(P)-dependent dehydrogenase (short-subunit alcohol dehydrogenase family)
MHRNGDISLEDLTWERRPWQGAAAYSDSKLHDLLVAFAVARRWSDVLSNALEPGWVPTMIHAWEKVAARKREEPLFGRE